MKELIYCRCGLVYGERPESYSSSNTRPCNFCPACSRGVSMRDCDVVLVTDSEWTNTAKHYFQPNYVDY